MTSPSSGRSATSPVTRRHIVDDVVRVHIEAFPDFFMTALGPWFLREYYRCVDEYPLGVLLTDSSTDGCIGFVAGFVDPASFYRVLRGRRLRVALAASAGIVRRPDRVLALFADYRRAGGAAGQQLDPQTAELSSLGVRPAAARRGVGSRLVRRFVAAAGARGARRVVLTTDAYGNERVNAFYQAMGFTCVRTFEARRGRVLNEYAIGTGKD